MGIIGWFQPDLTVVFPYRCAVCTAACLRQDLKFLWEASPKEVLCKSSCILWSIDLSKVFVQPRPSQHARLLAEQNQSIQRDMYVFTEVFFPTSPGKIVWIWVIWNSLARRWCGFWIVSRIHPSHFGRFCVMVLTAPARTNVDVDSTGHKVGVPLWSGPKVDIRVAGVVFYAHC